MLAEYEQKEATLRDRLEELDRRQVLATQREAIPGQIQAVVARAKERLANPTVELMSEVFYAHQLTSPG